MCRMRFSTSLARLNPSRGVVGSEDVIPACTARRIHHAASGPVSFSFSFSFFLIFFFLFGVSGGLVKTLYVTSRGAHYASSTCTSSSH